MTPGPLVVALVSGPAGKLAGRIGFRPVLLVGFAVFAGGPGLVRHPGRPPARVPDGRGCPATLIIGLGIGLTFPILSAAAVSSLHPERFAVGSAVNQTARQVGGALGVALLVVILGAPTSLAQALADFHHLWWFAVAMAIVSGVVCLFLGAKRAAAAPAVVPRAARNPTTSVGRPRPPAAAWPWTLPPDA